MTTHRILKWIQLAQDVINCRAFVSKVMNLWFLSNHELSWLDSMKTTYHGASLFES
jgi:hypothetical protein